MTFVVAAASGGGAATALAASLRGEAAANRVRVVQDGSSAVAWATNNLFVTTHDDSTTLVVLDGRLHHPHAMAVDEAEAVAHRYRRLGKDFASGLLGDYVIVLLDRARRRILVARDPLGVRPWYQAGAGEQWSGASDLATLVRLPWIHSEIDEATAIEYLAARTESRGTTVYRDVGTLRPGTTVGFEPAGPFTVSHHRWEITPDLGSRWADAVERCRHLLSEAVRARLPQMTSATCELSGGIDSSAVTGTLARLEVPDILAGRLVFDGPADERSYSDAVVDRWGISLVSSPPWIPPADEAAELTRRLRRPLPDPNFTMFATLHADFRSRGRLECLTGLGGDDAFVASRVASRVTTAAKLRQGGVVAGFVRSIVSRPRTGWTEIVRPTLHHLAPGRGPRLPGWVSERAVLRADLKGLLHRRSERVTGLAAIDDRIANLTSGYDAAILETRAVVTDLSGWRETHPFLDPHLIEAVYGFDPSWPVRGDDYRALEIAAYYDRLPPVVATRRTKAEFSEVFWPQFLAPDTLASVRSGPLADLGWLDPTGFDVLVANAKEGKANSAIPLSRCVGLDRWLRSL